ncbi:MAG: tetratricopeptide repeat protein, partial [Gemmataceae bacterium]
MITRLLLGIALGWLGIAGPAQAGLYYSAEVLNPLPAQWRGFLLEQRALRLLAMPIEASPLRDSYTDAREKLTRTVRIRNLTAAEATDLGALYIRFGQAEKAIEILRTARRQFPDDFRLAANLGTAWHLAGNNEQALDALDDAVRLAPAEFRPAEQLHRKFVQLRQKDRTPDAGPDDLFGRPLTAADVPLLQTLALWYPADGRLLWALARIA